MYDRLNYHTVERGILLNYFCLFKISFCLANIVITDSVLYHISLYIILFIKSLYIILFIKSVDVIPSMCYKGACIVNGHGYAVLIHFSLYYFALLNGNVLLLVKLFYFLLLCNNIWIL